MFLFIVLSRKGCELVAALNIEAHFEWQYNNNQRRLNQHPEEKAIHEVFIGVSLNCGGKSRPPLLYQMQILIAHYDVEDELHLQRVLSRSLFLGLVLPHPHATSTLASTEGFLRLLEALLSHRSLEKNPWQLTYTSSFLLIRRRGSKKYSTGMVVNRKW